MSDSSVRETGVQALSIHFLNVSRLCHLFHADEANVELKELISKIIDVYNKGSCEGKEVYTPIKDIELPTWKSCDFTPFQISIYVQVDKTRSRITSWLKNLGTKMVLEAQHVHYLFFFYRVRYLEKQQIKEIFTLTTGQAWHVVQKFSDYDFPTKFAKRLMAPAILRSKKRPITGDIIQLSEILKNGAEISVSDAIDKLFLRVKLNFRNDASIFSLSCFQNKKGDPLARGIGAEIGRGLVRLSKDLAPEDYLEILNHFATIAHGERTECFNTKETECDSTQLDFLEHFRSVDFELAFRLNKALIEMFSNFIYYGEDSPALNFCHKHYNDYFQANEYTLWYDEKSLKEWEFPPATEEVFEIVKGRIVEMKVSQKNLKKEFEMYKFSFRHNRKIQKDPILDYLEGEVRLGEDRSVYWRLQKMWYQIHADYLGLIHAEFRKMLISTNLPATRLGNYWPSPGTKEKRKAELDNKKYDVEAEYNQSYIDQESFFLGDKICPHKIELFDLVEVEKNTLYLYHVKEGFGQHTRDACSQILNAAKLLHSRRFKGNTDVVGLFYDMAITGDVGYRARVKEKVKAVPRNEFLSYFDRKLVFVYAFADTAKEKRLLEKEAEIKDTISADDIENAHKSFKGQGQELLKTLILHGYLTAKGQLTSKFITSTKASFQVNSLTNFASRRALYECLSNFQSVFNSTIARLELVSLHKELEKLGFEFKILQLSRDDYDALDLSKTEIVANCNLKSLPEIDRSEWEDIHDEICEGKLFTPSSKRRKRTDSRIKLIDSSGQLENVEDSEIENDEEDRPRVKRIRADERENSSQFHSS